MTSWLITGGTGSFGQALTARLLATQSLSRLAILSRDELKQHEMRQAGFTDARLRWFIGDVRDRDRLRRAFQGVDVVVHAAALKQVDTCELNPLEAARTNIGGAENVIEAALDAGVGKVLALGTDKAVDPTNLYGATKLVQEKLVVDANAYSGQGGTVFACTRYGNVLGSRGSVLPVFARQHAQGLPLTVTAPEMTRFVMTLEQCVDFVLNAVARMRGGEVFVPDLPAATIETFAASVTYPHRPELRYIGLRPGEKLHEALISPHEAERSYRDGHGFVVTPVHGDLPQLGALERGFSFTSDIAKQLDVREFRALAGLEERKAA